MKDALLRLVTGAMKVRRIKESYIDCGLNDEKIFDAWSEIATGVMQLIGEHEENFEDTVTYIALTAPILTNERRTEMLWSVYKKNHRHEVDSSVFISAEKMNQMVIKNGGYSVETGYVPPNEVTETPEGEWK